MGRVYVYMDWSQMESWLTAYFSKDRVLMEELEAQLRGGPKTHALNAQLLYGCSPEEANALEVNFQGALMSAYDAAKRRSHGFNYGMGPAKASKVFWIPMAEAVRQHKYLSGKYGRVVKWREALADDVYGVRLYQCPRCNFRAKMAGACPTCKIGRSRVALKFLREEKAPRKIHTTPFARRRIYLGGRRDGMNAVASQDPQSSGASIWLITYQRLHGWDPVENKPWTFPKDVGLLTWDPLQCTYGDLARPLETFVALGTYDSYVLETDERHAARVLDWVLWTAEQPWPQLDGLRLPAEGGTGYNWRSWHETKNPRGIKLIERKAFEYREVWGE